MRTLRLTTDNFHDNLMFIACRLLPQNDPGDHHGHGIHKLFKLINDVITNTITTDIMRKVMAV